MRLFLLILMIGFMIGDSSAQDTTFLVGKGKRADIFNEPYNHWSIVNYDHYQPDGKIMTKLLKYDLQGLKIEIVMGTWCSDSRREVPRFLKVIDSLHISQDNTSFLYVDRDKDDGQGQAKHLHIIKVPTFIMYEAEGQKEIGRIVETPHKTLEKDLLHLLKKAAIHANK
jgi:hypothetical protein